MAIVERCVFDAAVEAREQEGCDIIPDPTLSVRCHLEVSKALIDEGKDILAVCGAIEDETANQECLHRAAIAKQDPVPCRSLERKRGDLHHYGLLAAIRLPRSSIALRTQQLRQTHSSFCPQVPAMSW